MREGQWPHAMASTIFFKPHLKHFESLYPFFFLPLDYGGAIDFHRALDNPLLQSAYRCVFLPLSVYKTGLDHHYEEAVPLVLVSKNGNRFGVLSLTPLRSPIQAVNSVTLRKLQGVVGIRLLGDSLVLLLFEICISFPSWICSR